MISALKSSGLLLSDADEREVSTFVYESSRSSFADPPLSAHATRNG